MDLQRLRFFQIPLIPPLSKGEAENLPGLRSWPLTRYPHLVFYIERDDHIDVWRVLHGQRDIRELTGE